jgi:TldD protein
MSKMNRRDFLKLIGTGTAMVSMPLLSGCTDKKKLVQSPRPETSPDPAATHTTYFDRFGVDREMLERIVLQGLSAGGDFSEVFLQHKITHWVGLEDGKVDRAYTKVDLGAGIRVIKGEAQGFAYCEDLAEKALLAAAKTAAGVADAKMQIRPTPLRAVAVKNIYPIATPWSEVGIDKKVPLVETVDRLVRKRDNRIVKVNVYLSDETSRILVANSEGRLVEDHHPMTALRVSCVGRHKGKTETGGESAASAAGMEFFTPARLRRVAHTAVERTTLLFGADSPPAGSYPVVLAPGLTGILLHEAIGHGMEADFNRKGISIYADRIGKRIAPPLVNIYDDGTQPRLRGSINIDDESVPGQKTQLVEKGILRTYMHDRISARHYKLAPTGSGRRQSFRYPPVPRMRNTYMANGPHKAAEIIRSVKQGLYAEVFTNGQVHIGAGDFTFYLKNGRMIENGKLTRVVKDANLIGSGPKVLETIDMVADDLELYSGAGYCGKDGQRIPVGFGLPTVRAQAISIGGRKS